MKIREVFERDISLAPSHVICAQDHDDSVLDIEYNGYLFSPANVRHFALFFQEFLAKTQSYGVWVSGYFGVGKSHFLKTLYQLMQSGRSFPLSLHEFSEDLNPLSRECVLLDVGQIENSNLEGVLSHSLKKLDPELDSGREFISGLDDYFASRPVGHRLVFFIDEIWQYALTHENWSGELKNLVNQIRAGKNMNVLLVVTSQWNIKAIQEHSGKECISPEVKRFFSSSVELKSEDAYLIAKKLLKKNPEGRMKLAGILPLEFTLDEKEQLIDVYPFTPTQLHLFFKILASLRKVLSTDKRPNSDERELITLFNRSLPAIIELEVGKLLTFDKFFDSIGKYFDDPVREYIDAIENNAKFGNLDVALSKILVMTRYVPAFEANGEMLTSLVNPSLQNDSSLKLQIKDSLQRLTKEGRIEKLGNWYRTTIHYGILQKIFEEKKT